MSLLALSLMLAARPTVAVEVTEPEPTALRGWLVRRLLEEGYAVATDPRHAHGVVRVRSTSQGLVVETEGQGRRSFAIEAGPPAVQRLEVLHRALLGVEQTCDVQSPVPEGQPVLAVRFVDSAPHDALMEAVASATLHAGLTLSTEPEPGDTLVCLAPRGALVEVGLGPAEQGCAPAGLVLDTGNDGDGLDRAAQQLVAAVQQEPPATEELDLDALGGPPASALVTAMPPPEPRDDEPGPLQGPPRAEMRLGMSVGAVSRGRAIDPLVQAGWRMGKIDGIGGRLSMSLVPSSGIGMRVIDARLVIGPDWELHAGSRGHVELAALVGTDLHVFSDGTGDRTAGDVAFAAELPLAYSVRLGRATRLQLVVGPGLSSTAWEHRTSLAREARVAWSRPTWRVGVAVGISHGWRIE